MALRLTQPTAADLRSLAQSGAKESLTYAPVGMSAMAAPPTGYRLDRWSRTLGTGERCFERAVDAIRTWQVHRGAGLIVCADGPPAVDSVVAMAAPLPVGWIEVVCRVVAVVDEADRFGFTYGTLPVHPEEGEESFTVSRTDDGAITFEIVAASRPRQLLARSFSPVARRLQAAATGRYLAAMQSAVDAGG